MPSWFSMRRMHTGLAPSAAAFPRGSATLVMVVLVACSGGLKSEDEQAEAAEFRPPIIAAPAREVQPRVTETHRYTCQNGGEVMIDFYQGGEEASMRLSAADSIRLQATTEDGVFAGDGLTLTRAGLDILLRRGTEPPRRCRG